MRRANPVLSTLSAVAHFSVGSVVLLTQLVTLGIRLRKEPFGN